jgi:hypothetical protein
MRAYASRVRTIARALAVSCAISCAHERAVPPAVSPLPPRAAPAPLPFPETAFHDDAAPQPLPPPSRFETQRIGTDAPPTARYHGAPVDLDLKGADLANVFRLLADVGHVNIVVSGDVTGTITLRLKKIPWDQALEVVARARDLDLERDGNVIVVRTARKP